jgi:hypothetical protein
LDTTTLILLCLAAFAAGFTDAIVGGGGLIQTPAAMILLPGYDVATVIGSLKIPAFSGTGFAAMQYARKVKLQPAFLLPMMVTALSFSFAGSWMLTLVSNAFMKPVLLVVLTGVAVYTYSNKNFGQHQDKNHDPRKQLLKGLGISALLGLYDGFIGPGTGSFLILAFITILGFDFIRSSAHAKMLNLATNFGSILLFVLKGKVIWAIALPMAACNATGGWLGAKLALQKGNRFIRVFFLCIVAATLLRFAWDVFFSSPAH